MRVTTILQFCAAKCVSSCLPQYRISGYRAVCITYELTEWRRTGIYCWCSLWLWRMIRQVIVPEVVIYRDPVENTSIYMILIDLYVVVGVRLLTIRPFIFDDDEDSVELLRGWKCKWRNLSEIRLLFGVLILAGVLISSTCFGRCLRPSLGALYCI